MICCNTKINSTTPTRVNRATPPYKKKAGKFRRTYLIWILLRHEPEDEVVEYMIEVFLCF